MNSIEQLKQRFIDGEATADELRRLEDWYLERSSTLFWDIREEQYRGNWDRAEQLQKLLDAHDDELIDFYVISISYLD